MQRIHGEFNECSKLVPQTHTQAARQMHASKNAHFPAFTFLWSSGEATGKYLITGDLIRFPL